jgi:hypothetical protein
MSTHAFHFEEGGSTPILSERTADDNDAARAGKLTLEA